ncbi:hypothetical protein EW146_g895 [Bondarzewia mesenterica]|uniref:Uncharacterized protein n=1 Tax=Bondarzewia mesenterica TaxID=1095465 RepID=A0A4S4M5K1_9AGAM|nr:hypothetical protein EW146_g895 [Bondarzewia mesenterica]
MLIPPGIYDKVCDVICIKIAAGVYEPSNSSYCSRWFIIIKKDGSSLRLVHSLEPLNAVTIQHSGIPPYTDQITEQFTSYACGGMLNLYIGYNKQTLAESSTIIQPFKLPMACFALSLSL